MIKAIIQAGFGNQLFQYATAYALSRELNQPLEVDTSFFEWYNLTHPSSARVCGLYLLSLDRCTFNRKSSKHYWKYKPLFSIPFTYLPWYIGGLPIIKEDIANCRQDQQNLFGKIGNKGAALFGFWQNTIYFDKYIADLKRQFRPSYELDAIVQSLYDEISACKNSVGVHIRRGDFVDLGWDKGSDYYIKGMQLISQQKPDAKFFIVTDDKHWAREQFASNSEIRIIDINTPTYDIDEFFLLSSCHHQVISESTFGWWAAYLNTHEDKLIVIPKTAVGQIFKDCWIKI